ncbi:metal-dependent phosphohydrolase [Denitratisoma sp. DHT3]|uniref:HD domain-containing phosphohydrolase n=1 Tax=Denitratisoma sp. DHT3 TaxID=1981880 RepID=UPI0011982C67|nr:HD domain-containing phosphohydrolase [Denitratisoma sp. DHT3]QDX80027.1 metal-dependent phosphohydrolase [Denitratisoma sp. DHT3]
MPDYSSLLNPPVRDQEALQEFYDALIDKTPIIERDIARLRRHPQDFAVIADLFRALHNIKGDAAICKVDVGVMIAHPIETLLARMREDTIKFSELLAEVILLALDRLELATEALVTHRSLVNLGLPELVQRLDAMSEVENDAIDRHSADLIEAVTGFRPRQIAASIKAPAADTGSAQSEATADLNFFKQIALQLETHSPLLQGRSERLLRLARDTNGDAGFPVNPVQLDAAVYMHDVGMMFLAESVWLKMGKLSAEDLKALRDHPHFGAGLLERMPPWTEAAIMVAQHHEMPDGAGYPAGLKGADIHPGAKILAIIDAFEAVTLKHRDRGKGRSLLRAIAEINACDKQFDPVWIGHFNNVIRHMVEA